MMVDFSAMLASATPGQQAATTVEKVKEEREFEVKPKKQQAEKQADEEQNKDGGAAEGAAAKKPAGGKKDLFASKKPRKMVSVQEGPLVRVNSVQSTNKPEHQTSSSVPEDVETLTKHYSNVNLVGTLRHDDESNSAIDSQMDDVIMGPAESDVDSDPGAEHQIDNNHVLGMDKMPQHVDTPVFLSSDYTMWFDPGVVYAAGDNSEKYDKNLKSFADFSTIQGFWQFWNGQQRNAVKFGTLSVFKKGARPTWEDIPNGGRWVMQKYKKTSQMEWFVTTLTLALFAGEFDGLTKQVHNDEILGVSLVLRKKGWRIEVWNKTAVEDEKYLKLVDHKIRTLLNVENDFEFTVSYKCNHGSLDLLLDEHKK